MGQKPTTVLQHLFTTNFKKTSDLQKAILETIVGQQRMPSHLEAILVDDAQLEMGLFIKEFGHRLIPIQLLWIAKRAMKQDLTHAVQFVQKMNAMVNDAGLQ